MIQQFIRVVQSTLDERDAWNLEFCKYDDQSSGNPFAKCILKDKESKPVIEIDALNPGQFKALFDLPSDADDEWQLQSKQAKNAICETIVDLTYLAGKNIGDVPVELKPFLATVFDTTMRNVLGMECGETPNQTGEAPDGQDSNKRTAYAYRKPL